MGGGVGGEGLALTNAFTNASPIVDPLSNFILIAYLHHLFVMGWT
jgi:hypothetical protein